MIDLQGKVALVTGGSRGIGKSLAQRLAARGAEVVINYVRHRTNANEVVAEIEKSGGRCVALRANLADEDDIAAMFAEIRSRYSRLDIIVSNAASGVLKPVAELRGRHWDWAVNINARALMLITQQALPMMTAGGRIIAISSIGAVRAVSNYTVVGASKGALESLVRHLAVELGPLGITVNTVSAGVVETDALKKFPNREEIIATAMARTPLGRLTLPEDVANLTLFLCSDMASMIHGQTLVVDGGYAIHG
ncbi:short-chain dehydrogenase/reductase SDR [Desulfobulbus propionicus DSM 2032]|jgi:enoyl-[acyl-carrier protein] reductase III|uniref:Short-chain dehydrogenase/reductase SDR n=1 Tax=Desulfobulbus propionicus (strain ATCC 33891 / DSM 2032 / VKM B-1956 / 1pr3) TaxID=577650 RepID=A0A7U4DNI6_DESPD|nr:enoyl-[acyl-carrier-protein] reductase FabL [Desulfobulbus propionicus]ADW17111.1 short-chain dehydrogenase/reductase SDR [Desulfobulbus propionicus DSM 2032]